MQHSFQYTAWRFAPGVCPYSSHLKNQAFMYLNMDLDVQLKELTFKNKDLLFFKLS